MVHAKNETKQTFQLPTRRQRRQRRINAGKCAQPKCVARSVGGSIFCMRHELPFQRSSSVAARERVDRGRQRWSTTVVYFLKAADVPMVKIGWTTVIESRTAAIRACSPVPLEVIGTIRGGEQVEGWLHGVAHDDRGHGEWFRWTTRTRALVDLVLSHGMEGASLLCPSSFAEDHLIAEGISRRVTRRQGWQIGDNCKCENCILFANLDGQ